jgi:SAM-dependent methyltransferase
MQADWFASWFDSPHYHRLYAHRDEGEAARFIDAIVTRLRPREGARVLDLGCGAGRHARRLASKGLDTTGIDLSPRSIAEAAKAGSANLRFRRQDMRVPFGRQAFDFVFNVFTSFGYFRTEGDDNAVVRNIAAALIDGGCLVLDYLNVSHAERHLTPYEVRRMGGATYRISRWLERACLVKHIDIEDRDGHVEQHVERVARLGLGDFARMFAAHGLTVEQVYGDYRLGPYDTTTSPRVILVARKPIGRLLTRQLPADAAHGLGRQPQV